MRKNIILKNQKNSFTRQISKTKNCKNGQKRAKNGRFCPGGPNFAKIKKRLRRSLTFTPERLHTKFQKIWLITIGENMLLTDGQTNGQDCNHMSLRKNFWGPKKGFVRDTLVLSVLFSLQRDFREI